MDGPAFHVAAALIEDAKSRKKRIRQKKPTTQYAFKLGNQLDTLDLVITSLANLHHVLTNDWTERQREIVTRYEKQGVQKAVARSLGITQQAVSTALQQAHWADVKSIETLVDGLLASVGSNNFEGLNSGIQVL